MKRSACSGAFSCSLHVETRAPLQWPFLLPYLDGDNMRGCRKKEPMSATGSTGFTGVEQACKQCKRCMLRVRFFRTWNTKHAEAAARAGA